MKKFDKSKMSPSDCVELYETMNTFIDDRLAEARESGESAEIAIAELIEEAEEACGMPADDITRFCEIGEFVAKDREDRGIPAQDVDAWRHKRDALGALIDALVARAIENGTIDRDTVVIDPTIEELERLWDMS